MKKFFKSFFKKSNNISLTISMAIIALVLTASIVIQSKSVSEYKDSNIEGLRDEELKTQIASYKSKYEDTVNKTKENLEKIKEYQNISSESNESSNLINQELAETNKLLGLTDVTGSGLIITLSNTEYGNYSSEYLRNLVNELKYAGAEAISINDNRIINLTDIANVTNGFIVMNGDTRLSAPYTVKVIGDITYLKSTLNMKNTGFVDIVKANGLGINIQESDSVTIGKYNGTISANYMKEIEKE